MQTDTKTHLNHLRRDIGLLPPSRSSLQLSLQLGLKLGLYLLL
jgi:hypothetical protein